ncbi:unknown [Bacteroides sp. CAG:598]|nr:unknown [Bacteroides sp. CAG:598]
MYKGYPQARSDTPFLMGESSKTARTGFILIVQSPSLSNNIPLSGHHVRLLQ